MKLVIIIGYIVALVSTAPEPKKLAFRNLYSKSLIEINKPDLRIVGGHEATPHSLPYQALLEIYAGDKGWYCGGSLISENYIVTAGHCGDGGEQVHVTLGAHQLKENEETVLQLISDNIVVHEDFGGKIKVNDIAVIKLPQAITFTDAIQPIALPSLKDTSKDFVGATAIVSGWGLTEGKGTSLSDVLNYVHVEVIENSACERVFGTLEPSILCTSETNSSTCSGDSGGPLVVDDVLIGITSYCLMNCPEGWPTAYTRVTGFLEWLSSHTDVTVL